jgi:hypothetical protein
VRPDAGDSIALDEDVHIRARGLALAVDQVTDMNNNGALGDGGGVLEIEGNFAGFAAEDVDLFELVQ